MAHLTIPAMIGYTWGLLGLVWLAGLAFTKRTVHSEPMGSRLFQIAIILFGFTLLGNTRFRAGWLGENFLFPHARPSDRRSRSHYRRLPFRHMGARHSR